MSDSQKIYCTKKPEYEDVMNSIYLDWVNNYSSLDTMSKDYWISKNQMINLIEIAKKIFYKRNK